MWFYFWCPLVRALARFPDDPLQERQWVEATKARLCFGYVDWGALLPLVLRQTVLVHMGLNISVVKPPNAESNRPVVLPWYLSQAVLVQLGVNNPTVHATSPFPW